MRALKTKPREGAIFAGDIIAAYKEAFGMSWWQLLISTLNGTFKMADPYYQEADEDIILEVLKTDHTERVKYVLHDNDCDDRTFRLMGVYHIDDRTVAYPIFITWVEYYRDGKRYGHAVLTYLYKGKVRYIEPQNDNVLPIPDDWSLTLLCG
ncbi:unnamed protein product [marine sediment metagenome]|uniref:Uncharacterized protein n=1 Tax=marine sediment metagenome TaxID=412755 RepID=X0WMJ9_9ZZZZ